MLSTSVTLLSASASATMSRVGRFVALYTPLLYRWARRAGLADQDAADLVQDVLILLMKELPSFEYDDARRNFRGWLKTITINKCREMQRRRLLAAGTGGEDDPLRALPGGDDLEAFWNAEYYQHLRPQSSGSDAERFRAERPGGPAGNTRSTTRQPPKSVRIGHVRGGRLCRQVASPRQIRQELAGLLD